MPDTPRSEVVWRVLDTHSIRQFPLHFPSRSSPCAITFQLDSTARSVHSVYLKCLHIFQDNSPLQKKEKKFMSLYVRKKFAKYSPQVNPTSFLKIHASQYILAHETLKKSYVNHRGTVQNESNIKLNTSICLPFMHMRCTKSTANLKVINILIVSTV